MEEPEWLPRLPTKAILGDLPMSEYLRGTIKGLAFEPEEEPNTNHHWQTPCRPDIGVELVSQTFALVGF